MAIKEFKDQYSFLSNNYVLANRIEIISGGILVPTAQHVYQAAKFKDTGIQIDIAMTESGVRAKEYADYLEKRGEIIVDDWEITKAGIMRIAIYRKFWHNRALGEKLIRTHGEEIIDVEDDENLLGKKLMEVRQEFIDHPDDIKRIWDALEQG